MISKDLRSFYNMLQNRMRDELETYSLENNLTIRCNKAIVLLATLLEELRLSLTGTFESQDEEIHFFKMVKPAFLSQYFYYQDLLDLKVNEPAVAREEYYFSALKQIDASLRKNALLVKYATSGSTHLDDRYFLRGFVPSADVMTDRAFSTGYDERFGRITADQLLRDHVSSILEQTSSQPTDSKSNLKWTGSKADLIELIYGLETAGVINKGGADIKEIAKQFESLFNINLGNFYRQFLDIRLRKKEKTTFLNQMKEKLELRINDFS